MSTTTSSVATESKEVLPGVFIHPRIAETVAGPVEYDLTEGDGPVVLSVHGGIGGCDQGRVLCDWVDTDRYRILSPSRPGYLGTPLEVGQTMEQQADAFVALLDTLDIEKAALVGASAGGPPAYTTAIRHPDRVASLIVIDGVSGFYDMPETAGPVTQAIFLSDFGQRAMRKVGEWTPRAVLKSLFKAESLFTKEQMNRHIEHVLGDERARQFVDAFMATMAPYRPRRAGTMNDIEQYRQYTHLDVGRIQCPTLIIHGTHDADVKFYDGVYAYEHIPCAERFWIEEGSHLGFWISPNAAAAQQAAVDFLRRSHG
jgi:pimeloyl-ACP methyl ester carboxylesterase